MEETPTWIYEWQLKSSWPNQETFQKFFMVVYLVRFLESVSGPVLTFNLIFSLVNDLSDTKEL